MENVYGVKWERKWWWEREKEIKRMNENKTLKVNTTYNDFGF